MICKYLLHITIPHRLNTRFSRAVSAAVHTTTRLNAVTYYPTPAMLASRCQRSNSALETIKYVPLPSHCDFKGFIIFVATFLALRHVCSSFYHSHYSPLSHRHYIYLPKSLAWYTYLIHTLLCAYTYLSHPGYVVCRDTKEARKHSQLDTHTRLSFPVKPMFHISLAVCQTTKYTCYLTDYQ